jgi:hypothetical protein
MTGALLALTLVAAPLVWMLARRRHGFPALARREAGPEVDAGRPDSEPASV